MKKYKYHIIAALVIGVAIYFYMKKKKKAANVTAPKNLMPAGAGVLANNTLVADVPPVVTDGNEHDTDPTISNVVTRMASLQTVSLPGVNSLGWVGDYCKTSSGGDGTVTMSANGKVCSARASS